MLHTQRDGQRGGVRGDEARHGRRRHLQARPGERDASRGGYPPPRQRHVQGIG